MTQHNTPERRAMLDARAAEQRGRTPGFTPMLRKPPGVVDRDWNPAAKKRHRPDFTIIPAWMNRRTGEAHEHVRAKARYAGVA